MFYQGTSHIYKIDHVLVSWLSQIKEIVRLYWIKLLVAKDKLEFEIVLLRHETVYEIASMKRERGFSDRRFALICATNTYPRKHSEFVRREHSDTRAREVYSSE